MQWYGRNNEARQCKNWKPRSTPKLPKKHTPGSHYNKEIDNDRDRTHLYLQVPAGIADCVLDTDACNGQPYHITVCRGDTAKKVANATQGMGMNKFAADAPVMLVLSEKPYVATAALGAKAKGNDYRSMDKGAVCTAVVK